MHGPVVKIDGQSISGVTPDSIQVILSERLISHDKE
jgi:NADH:ubiquinone oxidoreductase subunit E